jgi:hypothetical protein
MKKLTLKDYHRLNPEMKVIYYGTLVEQLIRERYTVSQELAILRQRNVKIEEFLAYNAYAEECKAKAKEVLGLV